MVSLLASVVKKIQFSTSLTLQLDELIVLCCRVPMVVCVVGLGAG